jgi:hypothetical protein
LTIVNAILHAHITTRRRTSIHAVPSDGAARPRPSYFCSCPSKRSRTPERAPSNSTRLHSAGILMVRPPGSST